ncbi:MAG: chemotaxis protein CheW [Myxococcales bacterium]|nr:chemotaxis protein CheW [Myxococcales bacterium]
MTLSIVPAKLHDVWFVVRASAVQEILGELRWVPIVGAPPEMPGVIAWRGRAVAVLDLGPLSGSAAMTSGESRRRTVIVNIADATLALPVEGVREVQEVPDDAVRPAHLTRLRHSTMEVHLDGVPMPLIDLEDLLRVLAPPTAA